MDATEEWLEAASRLLGLEIPESCREGVLENLRKNQSIAGKFMNVVLPDAEEMAPVFQA